MPARINRALRRGLALEPARRFADMNELVRALTPSSAPRARWLVAGASVAAVAAAAWIAGPASTAAPRCSGFGRQIAEAWGPTQRVSLAAAFLATDHEYAPAAATQTSRVLDGYATSWVAMRTDACEATHVRGDQSEHLLDLRMQCLDRRRGALAGLVTALVSAGPDDVARAVDAALALEPLAGCADPVALAQQPERPVDPAGRAVFDQLTDELSAARNLLALGRYAESQALADQLVAAAQRAHLRGLEAEALLVAGQVTQKRGDMDAADQLLRDAAYAAEASHRDEVAARARIGHVGTGVGKADFELAHERARAAAAAVERAGSPLPLRQALATQQGILSAAEGHYDDAEARFASALEVATQQHGTEHLDVARALNNLGNATYSLGRYAESQDRHQQALAIRRRLLGDEHPDVATSRVNLGHALSQLGKAEDALAAYRPALRIFEATQAPDSPRLATILTDIGLELEEIGRLDDALVHHRRALEILEKKGSDRPEVGLQHNNLGSVLASLGRTDEALAEHRRALEIREKVLGSDHPDVAQSLTELARALIDLGRYREAMAALDRAMAIKIRALGRDHVRLAPSLVAIGQVHLAERQPARAIAPLQRALVLLEGGAPIDRATCEVLLARALRAIGNQREAHRHAAAAAARFSQAGQPAQAAEASALIAARR